MGNGYSAVLYGSAARGDFVPGRSDLNLMLITDDLSPARLSGARPRVRDLAQVGVRAAAGDPPGGMGSRHGRLPARDHRHAVRLRGPARPRPAGGPLRSSPADLRQALEREFRGKLLRLRQGYVAAGGDPAALGLLADRRARRTILVLLRGLLVLLGRTVPPEPMEVAAAAAAAMGIGRRASAQRGPASRGAGLALRAPRVRGLPGGGGPRGRASSINFSSEISDDALCGGPDNTPRARAAVERVRLQHDPDDGRAGQPGQGTDRDPAPAPGGPDSQPGGDGEGHRQAGVHHLHQHRRVAGAAVRRGAVRRRGARWRRPTRS